MNAISADLPAAPGAAVADLYAFVREHPRLFVLSGAGLSTDSGIPGYRDADGNWSRAQPVMLRDFLNSASARRRYWARSMIGWPMIADAQPNAGHAALAQLAAAGRITCLATQNVDGLHQKAGSRDVIELHGNLDSAVCLGCGATHSRASIQHLLHRENPGFGDIGAAAGADGHADLEAHDLNRFSPPACARCGGVLKPDVVFFGEGVPRHRVDAAHAALSDADAMLVVGSSLMVYSGYRFCEWADKNGKPIAAVNIGKTRGDAHYALKLERPCAQALPALVRQLAEL